MPFIIETFDKPRHQAVRQAHRPAHLGFLDSHEAAQSFIESDPFFQAGLFERVSITRWRKAYVAGTSHLPAAA